MVGSTYISDPRVWGTFYHNMLNGKFKPEKSKNRQVGGGIGGMYSNKPLMVPVKTRVDDSEKTKQTVKEVTPTAAIEERAKSEFKDAVKKDAPRVPIKAKKRKRKAIKRKTTKRATSNKRRKVVKKSSKGVKKGVKRKSTVAPDSIFKKYKT